MAETEVERLTVVLDERIASLGDAMDRAKAKVRSATDDARRAEHAKYARSYREPKYRMKAQRLTDTMADIAALPCRGAFLDVSCGRGETLARAREIGFGPVQGTEVVEALLGGDVMYAEAHDLPFADDSFDVVTMFDVIEHLLPGDDELACRELARVARRHVLITANNKPSFNKSGDDLHINKRDYSVWHDLFCKWFAPGQVVRLPGERVSPAWRIDL